MANSTASDKKCINVRNFSTALVALYVLCLLPMLILGFFNFPAADDLSMAQEVHDKFLSSGNVFAALGYGIYMGFWYYMNWTGYYFSAALTAMCPSAFSEGLYVLTVFIILGMLTAGVFVFFDALLAKKLGVSGYYSRIASVLTLFMMIENMPKGAPRNEAFYWYSGSINYCFMFGLGLLWLGIIIRLTLKPGRALFIVSCILGFLLGGANYMTALSLAVMSFMFIAALIMKRLDSSTRLIWLPCLLNIIGLVLSMTAPGNSVREQQLSSINPIVAIFRSVFHVFDLCIGSWSGFAVIIILAMAAVFAFGAAGSVKIKLSHPVLFSAFCFLMAAANIVPPLYATGNFSAGRMESIVWTQFVLMMMLIVMYVSVWLRQNVLKDAAVAVTETDENVIGETAGRAVLTLAAVLMIGLVLSVYVDRGYLTSTSAITDLVSGDAAVYARENKERLAILKDTSVTDAELKEHSVHPELLFFSDVTKDPNEWINTATAEYYGKSSVRLVDR